MKGIRNNQLRAKYAIISLYAIIAVSILYLLTLCVEIYFVRSLELGSNRMDVSIYSLGIIVARSIYVIVYLTCAVFFILWFTRAYRNLQLLMPSSKFHYKPWVAAVTWFVPVWNLFGPYNIATNLFDKTERFLVNEERMELRPKYDIVKGWWWALWIMSAIVIRMSERYSLKNPLEYIGYFATIIGFIISIICAFFAIKMIRNYREMEELIISGDGVQIDYKLSNDDLLDSGI